MRIYKTYASNPIRLLCLCPRVEMAYSKGHGFKVRQEKLKHL